MNEWVPFHESLRRGDKRGIPRAVRFVYLELSLEARPFGGRIPLPRGFKSDVDAVHDILGGKRSEIELALSLLTAPIDPTATSERGMIELSGPPERRVLTVVAHEKYVRRDLSTERVKKFRDQKRQPDETGTEQKRTVVPAGNAFQSVPSETGETPTEERRGEEKREEETAEGAALPTPPSSLALSPPEPKPRKRGEPDPSKLRFQLTDDWSPSPKTLAKLANDGFVGAPRLLPMFKNYWVPRVKGEHLKTDDGWQRAFDNWVRGETRELGQRDPMPPPPTAPARPVEHGPAAPITPEFRAAAAQLARKNGIAARMELAAAAPEQPAPSPPESA